MRNLVRLSSFIVLALAISTPAVSRASALCENIAEQLQNTTAVFGSTDKSRKYDAAIKAQSDQIRSAKYDMKRLGCSQGSVIVYGGANSVMCEKLLSTLDQMQSNLNQLSATKATLVSGYSEDSRRQELLQAYEANHCANDVSQAEATVQVASASGEDDQSQYTQSFTAVVTNEPQKQKPLQRKQKMVVVPLGKASENGSLKTLCVRTCDGGFFPISQGADTKDFRRDARVCSMMCPGTETELFYNNNSSDKPEEMMSASTGPTYAKLPKAFAYRDKPGAGGSKCGCNFSAYYREMMRREAILDSQTKPTLSQLKQSMAATEMRTELQTNSVAPENKPIPKTDSVTRKIRQVGPVFLQDDSAAIDLKRPAKNKLN